MLTVFEGTAVTTTVTFQDDTGALVDPTTVVLRFGQRGSETSWFYGTDPITKVSTGVYSALIDTSNGGGSMWYVVWVGTGACAVAQPGEFQVDKLPL